MINIKIIQNNINNTTNNNTVPVLELKIFHLICVLIKGALFLSRSVVAAHSALKTSGEPISEIQYYKYFNSKICSPNVGKMKCALWIKINNTVFLTQPKWTCWKKNVQFMFIHICISKFKTIFLENGKSSKLGWTLFWKVLVSSLRKNYIFPY